MTVRNFTIAIMFGLAFSVFVSDANADDLNEDDFSVAGVYVCFDNSDSDDWRATMVIPHENNDLPLTALTFDGVIYSAMYLRTGIAQRWIMLEDESDEIAPSKYQFVMDGDKQNGRFWLGYYDFTMSGDDGIASPEQVFYCEHMTTDEFAEFNE